MENFIEAEEIAKLWGISKRQVQHLCKDGRIKGAVKFGNVWAIPKDVEKPTRKSDIRPGPKPKIIKGEQHG